MILFTADWHIKLGQKNVPVEWAVKRYTEFFDQVHKQASTCDMHIIGGDLFDRIPSMEELALYFSFVRNVKKPTLIFDGNHEATRKNRTFFSQLKQPTRDINPLVNIVDISYVDEDLGFSVRTLTETLRSELRLSDEVEGVLVQGLKESSDAYQRGLRNGDVISAVKRKSIDDADEFYAEVSRSLEAGDKAILLTIERDNLKQFIAFRM